MHVAGAQAAAARTLWARIVANGFAAFQKPSAAFAGDPCTGGLLIGPPAGTCIIDPSPAGAQLLAAAIADAIGP
jgi:hypothetical protein